MKNGLDKQKFGPWAIVTGASSGIGEEYARQLSIMGFDLILVARRIDLLKKLGQNLKEKYGIKFKALQLDLSNPNAHEEIIQFTSGVDVGLLVSNAGMGRPEDLQNDQEDLTQIVYLNALSHTWLAHHYGQQFMARGSGGIIFTGAMGSTNGVPFMAIESGTKAFIEGISKSLNWELKEKGVNITTLITPQRQTPSSPKNWDLLKITFQQSLFLLTMC